MVSLKSRFGKATGRVAILGECPRFKIAIMRSSGGLKMHAGKAVTSARDSQNAQQAKASCKSLYVFPRQISRRINRIPKEGSFAAVCSLSFVETLDSQMSTARRGGGGGLEELGQFA